MTSDIEKGATSEQLWSAFRGPLVRRLRRLGARADEVDDLVQESFLRIHSGLDGLREPNRIAGWIHRLAYNVWVDARRSRRESRDPSVEIETNAIQDETDEPSLAAEIGRWLMADMEGLDATTREVLRRFELENEPQQSIANALGLSLSAVKARLLRGRAQMRRNLERCCEFEFDRAGQPVEARRRGKCTPECDASGASPCTD